MVAIIGEAALSSAERQVLEFADRFETRLVGQAAVRRTLDESFEIAWGLLEGLPREELGRLSDELLAAHARSIDRTETP